MKAFVSYIILFVVVTMNMSLQAQTIKQRGVTYRYNGKNKRTPIGGVYIKAVTANGHEISDATTGVFDLMLNKLKMGDRIGKVQVTKKGMMVFNRQAVDEWCVRRDPLCLILCDDDEFQKQKVHSITISSEDAESKYKERLAELEKQNQIKQLQLNEYRNKFDSVNKEYWNTLRFIDKYADAFVCIDRSEVDTIAQRALELFDRNEIEESLRLFEQGNYMRKLDEALHTKAQAQELRQVSDSADILTEKDIERCINNIKAQVAACKVKNDFKKAGELLKELADRVNSLDAIWEYAKFCHERWEYSNAQDYYQKYQEQLEKIKEIDEEQYVDNFVHLQNNLADLDLYCINSKSEAIYKANLEFIDSLLKSKYSANYESYMAKVQNNLAVLYYKRFRFEESEAMFLSALKTRKRLSKLAPSTYGLDLAMTQNNLADLYRIQGYTKKCEAMYKSTLATFQRLSKFNPSIYEFDIMMKRDYFADLCYYYNDCYDESEIMCKLSNSNLSVCELGMAMTQNNLADFYYHCRRYYESEKMYKSALVMFEQLSKSYPSVYELDVAKMRIRLANLYSETRRYAECETMYQSALVTLQCLFKSVPSSAIIKNIVETQTRLAELYRKTGSYAESEAMYKAVIAIFQHSSKCYLYDSENVKTRHGLANLYSETRRYAEAEAMYKSALKICQRFHFLYSLQEAMIQTHLADLYRKTQRYSESEVMYKSALSIYERLSKSNPALYGPEVELIKAKLKEK